MFKRRHNNMQTVPIIVDGIDIAAMEGESVAAAVLASSDEATRTTPVSGASRAPYCMMGVCFECLMEIDGIANRQACMVRVRPGMRITRQQGARMLRSDIE